MPSQTDDIDRLVSEAMDLYTRAEHLHNDPQYVQVYGFNEINVLLRRGEFLLKLAELGHG